MNAKILLPLLLCGMLFLSGSIALNIIQFANAENPNLVRSRQGLLLATKDIRRTGVLVANNPSEGWFTVSFPSGEGGGTVTLKAWVAQQSILSRSSASKAKDGTITEVSITSIEQKDLKPGEPIFLVLSESPERKRLEASVVWVGDMLPLSR